MPRLNVATRKRIVILRRIGHTITYIHKRLEEEKIYINVRSIQRLLAKFKMFHTINDLKRSSRRRLLTQEILDQMEDLLRNDDELTARKLRDRLCVNNGANDTAPSISTIKRFKIKMMIAILHNIV